MALNWTYKLLSDPEACANVLYIFFFFAFKTGPSQIAGTSEEIREITPKLDENS